MSQTPTPHEVRHCAATAYSGEPCTLTALPGLDVCAYHRPEARARASENGRKGGLARAQKHDQAGARFDPKALSGRWAILQLAVELVRDNAPNASQRAAALVRVVDAAISLRDNGDREAELDALKAEVATKLEQIEGRPRRVLDAVASSALDVDSGVERSNDADALTASDVSTLCVPAEDDAEARDA